jgi:SHAQKYF class myb-like DNA-binding protein
MDFPKGKHETNNVSYSETPTLYVVSAERGSSDSIHEISSPAKSSIGTDFPGWDEAERILFGDPPTCTAKIDQTHLAKPDPCKNTGEQLEADNFLRFHRDPAGLMKNPVDILSSIPASLRCDLLEGDWWNCEQFWSLKQTNRETETPIFHFHSTDDRPEYAAFGHCNREQSRMEDFASSGSRNQNPCHNGNQTASIIGRVVQPTSALPLWTEVVGQGRDEKHQHATGTGSAIGLFEPSTAIQADEELEILSSFTLQNEILDHRTGFNECGESINPAKNLSATTFVTPDLEKTWPCSIHFPSTKEQWTILNQALNVDRTIGCSSGLPAMDGAFCPELGKISCESPGDRSLGTTALNELVNEQDLAAVALLPYLDSIPPKPQDFTEIKGPSAARVPLRSWVSRENKMENPGCQVSRQRSIRARRGSGSSQASRKEKGKTPARWTEEEASRFIEGLALYGRDWERLTQHIGTRSLPLVKSHTQKHFIWLAKHGLPVPAKVAETGCGHTMDGKPLDLRSRTAMDYLPNDNIQRKQKTLNALYRLHHLEKRKNEKLNSSSADQNYL